MKISKSGGGALLVAIVGGSGAGKTWLAGRLQKRLGKETARLCLDDFYHDLSALPLARRKRLNFDHPRAIDWPALQEVLAQCQTGRAVQVPSYDFRTHTRRPRRQAWKPKKLVLVEGLWLLRPPALRRLFAFSIFLTCPKRERLRRRIERDLARRGRSRADIRRQFFEHVAPMHERYVAPQEHWASVSVRSPVSFAAVDRLAATLRSLDRACV